MQMFSIALVVGTGIMSVMTMRGTYDSLVLAQQQYYAHSRFADMWVSLQRAPQSLIYRLAEVPGVDAVDTRVTLLATLDLEDTDMPAQGRFVSVPSIGRPLLNDIQISRGRYIRPGADTEVIISEKFALARELRPGDTVRAIINGRSRQLQVVGIANSPEHAYAVPPGSLFPEDDRYGVFWMARESLAPAFDMAGAFNEAVFRLSADANPEAVMQTVDSLLQAYGGQGSYTRKDQLSHQILENELQENRVMGTVIPAIFLGVAVFLLHLVLGRLISTQRGEIAVLKAFGYSDWQVGSHFLGYAMTAVLIGTVLGAGGGIYLGDAMISLYQQYFDIPDLQYRVTPSLLIVAVIVAALGACTGSISAVWRAVRLSPAEAMRPQMPPDFRPGSLERSGLGNCLPAAARMILRNVERKPVQAFFSATGVAMSIAILVTGMFMFDSIAYMMDLQFRVIQREDVSVTFNRDLSEHTRFELSRIEGVIAVETYRQVPARFRAGHLHESVTVTALEPGAVLRRIVNSDGRTLDLPANGMVISDLLARRLQVKPGDSLTVEWLAGRRQISEVLISATVKDFIGMSAYVSQATLADLTGERGLISGAFLAVPSEDRQSLYSSLKQMPGIAGLASPQRMLSAFKQEMAESLLMASSFLLAFASIIAVGVIYNGARIALSERGRELASLRVMGFYRREVSVLLLGEQALITVLSMPMGCLLGYWLSRAIAGGIETDSFRIAFVTSPDTYLIACGVVTLAALASGIAVNRRLYRLDLIDVLKSRE
jgi:putative ABC transport system permease protein